MHRGNLPAEEQLGALPIDEPPFFVLSPAARHHVHLLGGMGVDADARVRRAGDGKYQNVFAAGEDHGGEHPQKWVYLAGFGMTIGTVFGRIAGEGQRQCLTSGIWWMRPSANSPSVTPAAYCEDYCAAFPAMEERKDFHRSRFRLPLDCVSRSVALATRPACIRSLTSSRISIPRLMSEGRLAILRALCPPPAGSRSSSKRRT